MPVPAIVIGLGGTGAWVATYVKKELLELGVNWSKDVKLLTFDTDKKLQAQLGNSDRLRKQGRSTGVVKLDVGEFVHIGGDATRLVRDVDRGAHPHVGSWLAAHDYLRMSESILHLDEGAGMFRQLGRLAVFKDVATESTSKIYNTLRSALIQVRTENPNLTNLQVFIVGSFAGGTGAGTFIDMALLMRQILSDPSVNMRGNTSIAGYFVLPQAFARTTNIQPETLQRMNSRAYAAMRESRRFTISFDHALGYPVHYREGGKHHIWNASVKQKLYDLIYFFDAQGENRRVGTTSIEQGIVPAIADAISAAIDRHAGKEFASHVTNVDGMREQRVNAGELKKDSATYGAMGTYSYVYPIHHIVEGWTHRVGIDLLRTLLQPVDFDSKSGLPTALATNRNRENENTLGREAALRTLQALTPVSYEYLDANGDIAEARIEPTLLPGDFAHIYSEQERPGSGIAQLLMERTIADWREKFEPHGDNKETKSIKDQLSKILAVKLYDPNPEMGSVKASDQQIPDEAPALGAHRVVQDVERFKRQFLGSEDARTGRRLGGRYRDALDRIREYQIERFTDMLDLEMQSILNGRPNNSPIVAKGGKLGYLKDYLDGMHHYLDSVQQLLKRVQTNRQEQGEARRNAIANTQTKKNTMEEQKDKRGLFGRGYAKEAFQSQRDYLQAEQQLVELLQIEAIEDAAIQTLNRLLDYVASARQSVRNWEDTLARQAGSLYGELLKGQQEVENDRKAADQTVVREVISNRSYEQERFNTYMERADDGWLNKLMNQVYWTLDHQKREGRAKAHFQLYVTTSENSDRRFSGDKTKDSIELWLDFCRQPFAPARNEESILSYLQATLDEKELGDILFDNSGTALQLLGEANPMPANFLRAAYQEGSTERGYLDAVINRLAQRRGQATTETLPDKDDKNKVTLQPSRFLKVVNSEDRFKLTVVYTQELIEIDKIEAYSPSGSGYREYMGTPNRTMLHIFPAEVHAAEYETRLQQELRQGSRVFSDAVTLQLEDLSRFKLFLMCYVYRLIRRVPERDIQGNRILVWKFSPDFSQKDHPQEIWLTSRSAQSKSPRLLDTLMIFNYEGMDMRKESDDFHLKIDYELIGQVLGSVREAIARQRVQMRLQIEQTKANGEQVDPQLEQHAAGFYSPELLGAIRRVHGERLHELLTELAYVDPIIEHKARIDEDILAHFRKSKNLSGHPDHDIFSVFTLMLDDEINVSRRAVVDVVNALAGLGEERISLSDQFDPSDHY